MTDLRFYVCDQVGEAGIVAGPFPTRAEAEAERAEISIGGDCDSVALACPHCAPDERCAVCLGVTKR